MSVSKSLCAMVLATVLPAAVHASTFYELSMENAFGVDSAEPVSFELEVETEGTITDLNLMMLISNAGESGTIAWGDLNASLTKDAVTGNLWSSGNPGNNDRLFVAFDDESTEEQTLNDVLADTEQADGTFATANVRSPYRNPQAAKDGSLPLATYNPEDPFSAFDGMELSGLWTITFFDDVNPDEGDSIMGWQIYGTTEMSAVPLPATLPMLLVGFGGLAALRRRSKS